MTPEICVMCEDDIEGVAALEAACFSVPWSKDIVSELVTSPYDETWVIREDKNKIIGYITYRISDDIAELMRVAVDPACRGRGYSKILMDKMMRSAARKGVRDLTLEVRPSNTAAVSLYRSYGFREETVRKGYYTDPEEDAVIMFKRG